MYRPTPLATATLAIPNLISQSPLRCSFLAVLFALAVGLFALSPAALAVDPPPDGGYPNGNTAEGDNALFGLTTGSGNTAIGFESLRSDTSGGENTGLGSHALTSNTKGGQNTAVGFSALASNKTGFDNTAVGTASLQTSTDCSENTAVGLAWAERSPIPFQFLFGNNRVELRRLFDQDGVRDEAIALSSEIITKFSMHFVSDVKYNY